MFGAPLVVELRTHDNDVHVREIVEIALHEVAATVAVGLHRGHQSRAIKIPTPRWSVESETGQFFRCRTLWCSIEGVNVKLAHSNSEMTSTLRPCPHQRHVTDSTLCAMTSGSSTLRSPPTL